MPALDASLFDGLTDAQREAVEHLDGPLLVLAGPGSGKTTVVTRRVANLIANGIPAWQILALTFTNKAAGEMAGRIDAMLPEDLPGRRGLTVTTFHSFCARMLRRYAPDAGIAQRFSIYDAADQRDAIKRALQQAQMSSKNWTPAAVGAAISNAKNRLLDATMFMQEASDFYTRSIAKAYIAYEKILESNDALDFDDLLLVTARLLKENPGVREELQARYQYLLIDEYQDTNHAQFTIAHQLASEHQNICVVGDPDQSIYGWRGADIRNILEFEQNYASARVVPLGQNFRSTGHIVAAAAGLIEHNKRRKSKRLYTEQAEGATPHVATCIDERHEANIIARQMRQRHDDENIAWKEMAVLYRINALSRVLEDAMREARVPHVIARGTAFYDRKEIKDALAYLRLLINPNDEISLRRIINTPTRGIGKTTLDRVEAAALARGLHYSDALRDAGMIEGLSARAVAAIQKFIGMVDMWRALGSNPQEQAEAFDAGSTASAGLLPGAPVPLADLVDTVIRESGLEDALKKSRSDEDADRLENLAELVSAATQFEPVFDDGGEAEPEPHPRSTLDELAAFLESIALVSDADAIDPDSGAVTLMTLHTAKGLEFDTVAVAGLEEGLLPHSRAATSEFELEEERRLCFVGMTRAKRQLLMTRAMSRTHRGLRERTIPSQFLGELPSEHVEMTNLADDFAYDQRSGQDDDWGDWRYDEDGSHGGLTAGMMVRHPTFGVGRVEAITPRPRGSAARVNFQSVGTKTLLLEYAKLRVVE